MCHSFTDTYNWKGWPNLRLHSQWRIEPPSILSRFSKGDFDPKLHRTNLSLWRCPVLMKWNGEVFEADWSHLSDSDCPPERPRLFTFNLPQSLNFDFLILFSCAVSPEFYGIQVISQWFWCKYFFNFILYSNRSKKTTQATYTHGKMG